MLAAGHSSRSSRGSPHGRRSGQPHPCQDRGQGRRDPAEDGKIDSERLGSRPPSRFDRPETADTSSRPTRRDQRAVSAIRSELLPLWFSAGSKIAAAVRAPTAGSPRPRRPRRLRFGDQGHLRPDAACLVGSLDQHPVAWYQSCGTRATDQAAEVIGRVGSAGLQRLERAHNFAEREPITSAPTVTRDLGKRRLAQRFPVVPW